MANYTNNYQLEEPTYAEIADVAVFNRNMTKIDDIMHASQVSLAPAYDSTQTYNEGDVVMYELLMYECTDDNVTGTWDGSKWQRTTAGEHGGGGTEVEANPSGTATAGDLTKLRVGQDIYSIPSGGGGGTTVVPNPQGTPTQTLNTIGINNVIYDIAGSGGGTGGGYSIANLWNYVDDNSGVIPYRIWSATLNDYLSNYDGVFLEVVSDSADMSSADWRGSVFTPIYMTEVLQNAVEPYEVNFTSYSTRSSHFVFTDSTVSCTASDPNQVNGLVNVWGVKFGGGSGDAETYSETKLYEYTDTALPSMITLSHDWSDFDAIVFDVTRSGDTRQNMMLLTSNLSIGSDIVWTGYDGEYFIYDLTSGTTLTKGNTGGSDIKITNIKGINFGGAVLSDDIAGGQWTQLIHQAGGSYSSVESVGDADYIVIFCNYLDSVIEPLVYKVSELNKMLALSNNSTVRGGYHWNLPAISIYDDIEWAYSSSGISARVGYNLCYIDVYGVKAKKNVVGALDYSTTEQDTGKKWIDGKPIYQKTIVLKDNNTDMYTYSNNEYVGCLPSNIGDYINIIQVYCDRRDTTYIDAGQTGSEVIVVPNPYTTNLYMTSNHTPSTCIVTIEYTKATA